MYTYIIHYNILSNFRTMSKKTRLAESNILAKTLFLLSSMVSSYGRLKFD